MSLLQVGTVELEGFELPSRIGFGGRQQLAVHRLIGGVRVIDVLGRDDSALVWSGVLSGSDAAERARTLDAVRVAGDVQTLRWDAFCYSVIIAELHFDFRNPWWIPYRISCTVQRDLAQGTTVLAPSAITSVLTDLASAQSLVGSTQAEQIASVSSSLATSVSEMPVSSGALTAVQSSVEQGIQAAQVGLQSGSVSQTVSSAGSLAQLCCARGFLNRSATNILQIGV